MIQCQQQQYQNTKVGASSTRTTSQHEGWSIININTRLEIFSTELTSQQHQHKARNLQHEAGISTTSTRSWKSSALGWHHNTRLVSQQHQHKAGNVQTRLASQQHKHEVGNLQQ
jgi:hypothetical protein